MAHNIDEKKFLKRAEEGYNLVPVTSKYLGDLETPLSVYLKVADAPNIINTIEKPSVNKVIGNKFISFFSKSSFNELPEI